MENLSRASTKPRLERGALRAAYRARRRAAGGGGSNALSCGVIRAIAELLPSSSPVVAGYFAMGGEADPAPLLAALRQCGARIAMVGPAHRGQRLRFQQHPPRSRGQRRGPLGMTVPAPLAPNLIPDMIIAPAVAVTLGGCRLGMGGGFYDRTIAHLRRAGRRVLIFALIKPSQIAPRLPLCLHDQHLDGIIVTGQTGLRLSYHPSGALRSPPKAKNRPC